MDADEIKEEIAHQHILLKEYRKRLRVLEQQAAKFGVYVPPYIQVEINELNENTQECKRIIETNKQLFIDSRRMLLNKCNKALHSEGISRDNMNWLQLYIMNDMKYTKQGVEDLLRDNAEFTQQDVRDIKLISPLKPFYSPSFIYKHLKKIITQLQQQIAEIENL